MSSWPKLILKDNYIETAKNRLFALFVLGVVPRMRTSSSVLVSTSHISATRTTSIKKVVWYEWQIETLLFLSNLAVVTTSLCSTSLWPMRFERQIHPNRDDLTRQSENFFFLLCAPSEHLFRRWNDPIVILAHMRPQNLYHNVYRSRCMRRPKSWRLEVS